MADPTRKQELPPLSGTPPEDRLLAVAPVSLQVEAHDGLDGDAADSAGRQLPRRGNRFSRFVARHPTLRWLTVLGPGLIAANAGNDAGGVFTYASVGAGYGYTLLWMMLLITFFLAVVQEMAARLGAATGKGLSDLIRENFSIRWTAFAMLALLVANTMLVMSEFAGIAASSELFGISRYVSIPVVAIVLWYLVARGSYDRVETIFLLFTFGFFAYIISAFVSPNVDWGAVAKNTVVPSVSFDSNYILTFVATVGTTITPYMQLFLQSSVVEKGVTMRDYKYERADAYIGAIFSNLIAFFIITATAVNLFYNANHGSPYTINDAADAANALQPVAGAFAKNLFGIGLFGASMLAAGVLPLATAYSICEAFGFEKGVKTRFREAPVFWGMFTGIIVLGTLVPLIPNLPLVQLLIIVQALNALLLPVILYSILRLVNNREIMGQYVNGRITNIIAWATFGFVTLLSLVLIVQTVLGVFGINLGS